MAHRLNWAMEKMGWRMPDDIEDMVDADFDSAEIHEYPFASNERENSFEKLADSSSPATTPGSKISEAARSSASTLAGDRKRIITVHPRSFGDALIVGESFREGIPVIMNLTDMDDAEARRIIDFAAGLSFGLQGVIERVTTRVFLLSPRDTEVSHERSGYSSYR